MLEFHNVEVYDLKESIIASRNAMRLDMPDYDSQEEFEKGLKRAKVLAKAGGGSGHSSFRKGIRVAFDMKYTQYITKQFQRYHWFEYVTSSSLMHRITKMDFSKCVNKYVSRQTIEKMNELIAEYNRFEQEKTEEWVFYLNEGRYEAKTHQDVMYTQFMIIISECPMGAELFVRVSTNYEQLATIAKQREHHKLKEDYAAFMEMVRNLPYGKELILCDE